VLGACFRTASISESPVRDADGFNAQVPSRNSLAELGAMAELYGIELGKK
jgi:hypothetical protein